MLFIVFYKEAVLKISKIHRKQTDKMGYSRENPNRGAEDILLWKPPCNFSFFTLSRGNSRQNKAQSLDIPRNCVRFLRNFKAKKKDPSKFHIIFSWSPLEIPLCFQLTLGNSTCYFFDTPGNSISSTPLFGFFLE